jgi:hypothetical protein
VRFVLTWGAADAICADAAADRVELVEPLVNAHEPCSP